MAERRAEIAVVGAGAWGTAIACHLAARAHAAPHVVLVARSQDRAASDARDRVATSATCPASSLPAALAVADDLAAARDAGLVFIATPIGALESVVDALAVRRRARAPRLAVEGIRRRRRLRRARARAPAIAPRWPAPVGVVSGPSFAARSRADCRRRSSRRRPTARSPRVPRRCCAATRCASTRPTTSIGVEVGGAVKNVLAIAAGLSDGLGYGHNARAALITRGLAEISRLAVAAKAGGARR